MADHDFSIKRRPDGSIDFDAYRADATQERKAARDHLLWHVALPSLWSAPARLSAKAMALTRRGNGLGVTRLMVDRRAEETL